MKRGRGEVASIQTIAVENVCQRRPKAWPKRRPAAGGKGGGEGGGEGGGGEGGGEGGGGEGGGEGGGGDGGGDGGGGEKTTLRRKTDRTAGPHKRLSHSATKKRADVDTAKTQRLGGNGCRKFGNQQLITVET